MKGDCQRFRVAGQRRFGGVWDEFSRGFPSSLSRAKRGNPMVYVLFSPQRAQRSQRTKSSSSSPPKNFFAKGLPRFARDKKPYSYFNAFNGSMFMARRAGM